MSNDLAQKKCIPCEAGTPPLPEDEAQNLLKQTPGWSLDEKKLKKEFRFNNFTESIEFVNKVAAIAEEEGHHPDIHIFYSIVRLTLWTHASGGVTENDFILAAKVNEIN